MKLFINESPVATISTDVDTFIIPDVPEENADAIISFATRTDDVEDCEWFPVDDDLGEIEITTDPVFFKLILLWAYRKKLTISNKRIGEIMRDNNIYENKRSKRTGRSLKEQDVEIEQKYEFQPYYIVATFEPETNREIYRTHCKTLEKAYDEYDDIVKSLTKAPNRKSKTYRGVRVAIFKITLDKPQVIKSCVITRDSVVEESMKRLRESGVEIEVKNKGILEVPEGKNVDDLPMSHFEKLVKKNGLSKITKALNNLQVWNKNDDKKLSKWAGDMIDKLTKKYGKNESLKEDTYKSYWKYDVESDVFNRNEDSDTYLTKYDIRKVKLIPCKTPEDCYYDERYWAVCSYEYPYDEFYGTKQEAYDMLLTSWNNSKYERIHDI